jgi:hypothetical protein
MHAVGGAPMQGARRLSYLRGTAPPPRIVHTRDSKRTCFLLPIRCKLNKELAREVPDETTHVSQCSR